LCQQFNKTIGDSGLFVAYLSIAQPPIQAELKQGERDNMVYFGQYLLSDVRRKLFASHPEFGDENLEQRLKQVHHSDVENFQVWRWDENEDVLLERLKDNSKK